jgi:hypothetical protein|tara:strand:+ start:114 stop:230 length:117 start_codon:yes stop_codon:yes gene_type:complete
MGQTVLVEVVVEQLLLELLVIKTLVQEDQEVQEHQIPF